jgi:hypothetical protein
MTLKGGIVEPQETSIARQRLGKKTQQQRLGKQTSAATDTQATMEKLLGRMFSVQSLQSGYKEFSREAVEFQIFKWTASREFGSAMEAEKTALRVQVCSVNQRATSCR